MARVKKKDKHVLVRLPADLHEQIVRHATVERRSVNSEIVELLSGAIQEREWAVEKLHGLPDWERKEVLAFFDKLQTDPRRVRERKK